MKIKSICLLVLLLVSLGVKAQIGDREIFDRYVSIMQAKKSLPMGELMVETSRFFQGTPYVAATLEKEPEGLVVNLRELDCTTLVENVLALSRTLQSSDPSFDNFCRNLQQIRYREGQITDYTDRLHYITDWLYENSRKGLVKDAGLEVGGQPLAVDLSFISTHPDSYKPLKGHPELVRKMADKEREINARSYFYLPLSEINVHAGKIKEGDIICFVTTIKGLDVTHMGIACRVDGKLTFIHASSTAKQVIVNDEPLFVYATKIKSNKGILVIRPLAVH